MTGFIIAHDLKTPLTRLRNRVEATLAAPPKSLPFGTAPPVIPATYLTGFGIATAALFFILGSVVLAMLAEAALAEAEVCTREACAKFIRDDCETWKSALLERQAAAFNAGSVGRTVPVLLEREGRHAGQLVGRTPYMQAIHVPSDGLRLGDLVPVAITECHAHSLGGIPAAAAGTEREAFA